MGTHLQCLKPIKFPFMTSRKYFSQGDEHKKTRILITCDFIFFTLSVFLDQVNTASTKGMRFDLFDRPMADGRRIRVWKQS